MTDIHQMRRKIESSVKAKLGDLSSVLAEAISFAVKEACEEMRLADKLPLIQGDAMKERDLIVVYLQKKAVEYAILSNENAPANKNSDHFCSYYSGAKFLIKIAADNIKRGAHMPEAPS